MKILEQKIHYDNEKKKTFLIQKLIYESDDINMCISWAIFLKSFKDYKKNKDIGYCICENKTFKKIIELE